VFAMMVDFDIALAILKKNHQNGINTPYKQILFVGFLEFLSHDSPKEIS
jgi:hypothetical protein